MDDVIIKKIEKEVTDKIGEFSFKDLQKLSNHLYKNILADNGTTFAIILIDNYQSSSAINTLKADFKLKIYDKRRAKETDLGFIFKSSLHSHSMLFNAGEDDNFIYSVNNFFLETIKSFNARTYKQNNGLSKLTFRLQELDRLNAGICFKTIQSRQLWKNLKMVDGDLPDILAWALYYRWFYGESSLKIVSDLLEKKDPLNFYNNQPCEQKLYEYKIMRFLTEVAMGMTSETPWLGEYDSFGGVIIAKKNGDVVCFHIYDFNLFRNYLLNNTMFEQASTGEDPENPGNARSIGKKYFYGWLIEDGNELSYKINLQIRFK